MATLQSAPVSVTWTAPAAPTCSPTLWVGLFSQSLLQSEAIPSAQAMSRSGCEVVLWSAVLNGETLYALTYATASPSFVAQQVFGPPTNPPVVTVVARFQNGQQV